MRRPGHAGDRELGQAQRCRVLAGLDIHEDRLVRIADHMAEQQGGRKPLLARRMEEVYANKDVDAVVVATPDHWHTPASILACQAGKDVYVEKPFSHNIWEGRKLVEAARKYRRLVQVGTQNRSAPYTLAARDYIQSENWETCVWLRCSISRVVGRFISGKAVNRRRGFRGKPGWGRPAAPISQPYFSCRLALFLGLLRRRPCR